MAGGTPVILDSASFRHVPIIPSQDGPGLVPCHSPGISRFSRNPWCPLETRIWCWVCSLLLVCLASRPSQQTELESISPLFSSLSLSYYISMSTAVYMYIYLSIRNCNFTSVSLNTVSHREVYSRLLLSILVPPFSTMRNLACTFLLY